MTWAKVKLRDLGTWYGGGTPSKSNPDFWTNGDVPWLSPKDMGPEILRGTRDHVTAAAVVGSSTKLVPPGAVAVVTRSGILERTLPVAQVPFATAMNQDMKAVVPRDGIDPGWIAWGLRAYERELLRDTRKAGTTVASIEMPRWYSFELPVPPLEEQRRIVAILEDHLSRLDAADRYLAFAMMRSEHLMERTLSHQFLGIDGEATTLGRVARWGSGGTPTAKTRSFYDHGTIPWVNSGDLRDGLISDAPRKITELGLASSSAKWVPVGSVLVAMYGATIGKTGLTTAPVTTNQAVAFATPTGHASAEWLQWFIRSQLTALRAAGKGGAQPNISQTVLKAWPVIVPEPDTQQDQIDACRAVESEALKLRASLAVQIRRSAALRRSLLAAAFNDRLAASEALAAPETIEKDAGDY